MPANSSGCVRKEIDRHVVPWYNPEQFHKVYEYLYHSDLTKRRWAVDQISVWDTRCHPSLPTPIEASLYISRAIIQDILFANGTTMCQEKDIEMLYCMALIRFVNLSVELHQTNEKQTVSSVAQCLGIPSWIVDLRNEASHSSSSPTLSVLRLGAEAAMKYLDKSYWKDESKKLKCIVKELVDIEEIKELILNYQATEFKLLNSKHKAKHDEIMKTMKVILKKLNICMNKHRKEFIEVLAMDGFFILLESDLITVLNQREMEEFNSVNYDKTDDDSDDSKEEVLHSQPSLPKKLEEFWYSILYMINKKDAVPEFIEALLYTQADRSPTGQRQLAGWVLKILKIVVNPDHENSRLCKCFQKNLPLFDWNRLLYAAVAKPCIYTPYIFPLISCHLELKADFARSLMNLLAISQGQAVDPNIKLSENHTAFTLEKLKQSKKLQELKRKQKKDRDNNIWSLAPDSIDFSKIPIGAVLNSSAEECELDFYQRDFDMESEVQETLIWGNKNDEDMDMDECLNTTVEQNTFEEDKKIIEKRKRTGFLYRCRK